MKSLSLSAGASMWANGRILRRNPRLTICAEVHQREEKLAAFFLNGLIYLIYKENNHCKNQWESYNCFTETV